MATIDKPSDKVSSQRTLEQSADTAIEQQQTRLPKDYYKNNTLNESRATSIYTRTLLRQMFKMFLPPHRQDAASS